MPEATAKAPVRQPPPECLQNCLASTEACNQSIVRFNERMESNRKGFQTRATEEPDSVMARRSIVPLVFTILFWVFIVYVWRLCSRLIEQNPQGTVLGTRGEGIGILVPFVFLWLMSMWSYVRVLFAGPGLVRDYVPESDPPLVNMPPYANQEGQPMHTYQQNTLPIPIPAPTQGESAGISASGSAPYPAYNADLERFGGNHASSDSMRVLPGSVEPPAVALHSEEQPSAAPATSAPGDVADVEDPSLGGVIGAMGAAGVAAAEGAREGEAYPMPTQQQGPPPAPIQPGMWAAPQRRPENDPPPLSAAALYCHRCRRVKPPRAHHCRRCGTCVLKMDHHCPWVGGCVGSQNQRFFFIFVLWVTLLELYTLVTTAVFFHRGVNALGTAGSAWKVDGFLISLFPITAMFGIFTTALLLTHVFLMAHNMTTIEHMGISRVASRERVLVDRWFGMQANQPKSSIPGAAIKAKRGMVRDFDREWGRLTKEANMWWLGGAHKVAKPDAPQEKPAHPLHASKSAWRTNVEQALGTNVLLWVLPLGTAPNTGLDFPVNPRFGPQGVWQKRADWPAELL